MLLPRRRHASSLARGRETIKCVRAGDLKGERPLGHQRNAISLPPLANAQLDRRFIRSPPHLCRCSPSPASQQPPPASSASSEVWPSSKQQQRQQWEPSRRPLCLPFSLKEKEEKRRKKKVEQRLRQFFFEKKWREGEKLLLLCCDFLSFCTRKKRTK